MRKYLTDEDRGALTEDEVLEENPRERYISYEDVTERLTEWGK